jgi:hypothetical protein
MPFPPARSSRVPCGAIIGPILSGCQIETRRRLVKRRLTGRRRSGYRHGPRSPGVRAKRGGEEGAAAGEIQRHALSSRRLCSQCATALFVREERFYGDCGPAPRMIDVALRRRPLIRPQQKRRGIVSPRVFAVLRLMTRLNFEGSSTSTVSCRLSSSCRRRADVSSLGGLAGPS